MHLSYWNKMNKHNIDSISKSITKMWSKTRSSYIKRFSKRINKKSAIIFVKYLNIFHKDSLIKKRNLLGNLRKIGWISKYAKLFWRRIFNSFLKWILIANSKSRNLNRSGKKHLFKMTLDFIRYGTKCFLLT